jgi:hypothetical protein
MEKRILFTMSREQYLSHTFCTCLISMANELNFLNSKNIFTIEGENVYCNDSTEIHAIFNLGKHSEYLNNVISNEK